MRLLVLGGTAWLGGEIVATAVARGHAVTCLARGVSGGVPDGARFVRADRETVDAYADVSGPSDEARWDAVVDLSRDASQVRGAVAALRRCSTSFVFVSSVSVYADTLAPGQAEDSALVDDDEQGYAGAKAAGERAVVDGFGPDASLVVRAGLIGGPGDETGRSGYWPARFAEAAADRGPVLVPDCHDLAVQLIDVRDLAGWIVGAVERGTRGTIDAVGDSVPLVDLLEAARQVAGFTGEVVPVSEAVLDAHGVQPWAGRRSLPLWVPTETHAGFGARSGGAGRAAGLAPRPLAETLGDVLRWHRSRPEAAGPLGAGLARADELDLLAALRH